MQINNESKKIFFKNFIYKVGVYLLIKKIKEI
jgi:hypothetical protein